MNNQPENKLAYEDSSTSVALQLRTLQITQELVPQVIIITPYDL